jgi:hypothetical protein
VISMYSPLSQKKIRDGDEIGTHVLTPNSSWVTVGGLHMQMAMKDEKPERWTGTRAPMALRTIAALAPNPGALYPMPLQLDQARWILPLQLDQARWILPLQLDQARWITSNSAGGIS